MGVRSNNIEASSSVEDRSSGCEAFGVSIPVHLGWRHWAIINVQWLAKPLVWSMKSMSLG
jgi:hypothetical protein